MGAFVKFGMGDNRAIDNSLVVNKHVALGPNGYAKVTKGSTEVNDLIK
jgi:hypothetical protein